MLFVIVFTEKVNAGGIEASSNAAGGKVSSLDCTLEIGRSKDTSAERVKRVHVCWGPALSFFYFAWMYGILYLEILLSTPANAFTKQIILRALLIDEIEVYTAD